MTEYTFAPFPIPGVSVSGIAATAASGVYVAGDYSGQGTSLTFVEHNGTVSTVQYPSAIETFATGVNSSGVVVGGYEDSESKYHAFIYSNGAITSVTPADADTSRYRLAFAAINDSGVAVGSFLDKAGDSHGFVDSGGTV